MSNLNDLYKESGIKPGGSDKGPIHGPSKPPSRRKGSSLLISIVISAVIFLGVFAFLQTGRFNNSSFNIRNYGIFIVGLIYVVNIIIRIIRRLYNKMNDGQN